MDKRNELVESVGYDVLLAFMGFVIGLGLSELIK